MNPYFLSPSHIFRKGKHASTAKIHLGEVVKFFNKIDPILGTLASKSMPGDTPPPPDGASKKSSSSTAKKRKNNGKESSDSSPKKKANMGNNGTLSISQRETRAMELLAKYLEDCGGTSSASLVSLSIYNASSAYPN